MFDVTTLSTADLHEMRNLRIADRDTADSLGISTGIAARVTTELRKRGENIPTAASGGKSDAAIANFFAYRAAKAAEEADAGDDSGDDSGDDAGDSGDDSGDATE